MTPEETRNLEVAISYEDLYNHDIERFVHEVYAHDCVVHCMGGPTIRGEDEFLAAEQTILAAAPKRVMHVTHRHAAGDVVILEAFITDPGQGADWTLPFIAVLTCRDGKVHTDRSYAEWPRWPGL